MKKELSVVVVLALMGSFSLCAASSDGSVLPFPEPKSASTTGKTLKDSKHQWRKAENHLPKDAPNFDTFGIGEDSCSPVSQDYFDRAPFKFTGKINKVNIKYID